MFYTVYVDKDDLKDANIYHGSECPMARAIKRTTGMKTQLSMSGKSVVGSVFDEKRGYVSIKLPPECYTFVEDYKDGKAKPFSFELNVG